MKPHVFTGTRLLLGSFTNWDLTIRNKSVRKPKCVAMHHIKLGGTGLLIQKPFHPTSTCALQRTSILEGLSKS
jgi:hypothetical protein